MNEGFPPDEPEGSPEPTPTGRSRYEDYDLSIPPPSAAAPRRRTPFLVFAAVVLAFAGLELLLIAPLIWDQTSAAGLLVVLGLAELTGAVLVALLHPLGRPLGIVLGILGVVLGLVQATSSPANGLVTMGLNGFVIYALASSGPSFRRG